MHAGLTKCFNMRRICTAVMEDSDFFLDFFYGTVVHQHV